MIEMPILVQWKWQERTKTFLVIFHFYDDFSKANLRLKGRQLFTKEIGDNILLLSPTPQESSPALKPFKKKNLPIMTWAPSHREVALLSDLLSYANIIGGLSGNIRRNLRHNLEIVKKGEEGFVIDWKTIDALFERISHPYIFVGFDLKKGEMEKFCCFELCPEYLDYLKEIVKPYLKE
jgi:hypothetical protein